MAVVLVGGTWIGTRVINREAVVKGRTWVERLSNDWEVEYHNTAMHHAGPDAKLFRRDGRARVLLADLIQDVRSIGTGCLVYSTSRGARGLRYYVVCRKRLPILLVDAGYENWQLGTKGLEKVEQIAGKKRVIEVIDIDEIRRRGGEE